jgi:peptidoglycan/xylan/chitin deacetylase (PgdA/CDA1 family)
MNKSIVYRVASLAGMPRLFQRIFVSDGAAILMYHAVVREPLPVPDWCFIQEDCFREQMTYLRKHCRVVPLKDIPSVTSKGGGRPIVAVTFDDGFQNNYDVALPILRDLSLPATIFLATDFVDSDDTLWFCRVNEAIAGTRLTRLRWEGQTYNLSTQVSRAGTHAALQVWLKRYRHPELLEKARYLISALGGHSDKPILRGSPYRMLGATEIREMTASGLIDFGAHTCSHAILSGLPEFERNREITASLAAVERLTEDACTLFAFPNGRASDYGPADVGVLRERKVAIAVTTIDGPNDRAVPALEMRRYGVGADTSMALYKLLTHHVLWRLRK